ncbi:hypothetical protein N7519_007738 [Penicillium mononematosum]|uniref:uncharacterized protein n=1 Tax=Penicillium mononematosum TaxID=268346 RepID=UPI002548A320|nr:uncharacterized protein N7519_007738 [Penicillium mononematosum]KAJ6186437.1 hypothetical protein N7519_007738 [Penicillium mononematosum]
MATELVRSDDLTTDTSTPRISNPKGLAILSRLDTAITKHEKNEKEIKDLQKRMARFDRIVDSILAQRHNVLDEWAG